MILLLFFFCAIFASFIFESEESTFWTINLYWIEEWKELNEVGSRVGVKKTQKSIRRLKFPLFGNKPMKNIFVLLPFVLCIRRSCQYFFLCTFPYYFYHCCRGALLSDREEKFFKSQDKGTHISIYTLFFYVGTNFVSLCTHPHKINMWLVFYAVGLIKICQKLHFFW